MVYCVRETPDVQDLGIDDLNGPHRCSIDRGSIMHCTDESTCWHLVMDLEGWYQLSGNLFTGERFSQNLHTY